VPVFVVIPNHPVTAHKVSNVETLSENLLRLWLKAEISDNRSKAFDVITATAQPA
jgi:hypothetical protein